MGCDDDIVKCLVFWANFFLAVSILADSTSGLVICLYNLNDLSFLMDSFDKIMFSDGDTSAKIVAYLANTIYKLFTVAQRIWKSVNVYSKQDALHRTPCPL